MGAHAGQRGRQRRRRFRAGVAAAEATFLAECEAEAAAEARDAAVAESITLRKKLSVLEVEKDELHAARDTAAGRTVNLQRSIISLKAEVATSQQHGADRLAALAEEHTHRLGDDLDGDGVLVGVLGVDDRVTGARLRLADARSQQAGA